jgi:hypothetical protein
VCLVGNFDDAIGSSTRKAIESVATAAAAPFGGDDFPLIEWFPRDSGRRFSELTLTAVPGTEVEHGTVAIGSGDDAHTIRRTTAIVRFADPRWTRRTENELARLLGEEEIRDLRSFAGLPGDYTPELRFGSTGERLAKSLRAHNHRIIHVLDAPTKEWTDR